MTREELRGMGRVFRRTRPDPKNPGKRIESPLWWVQYYRDGHQVRKSAGTTNRHQAVKFLRELEARSSRPKRLAFRQRAYVLIRDFTGDKALVDEFMTAIEPIARKIEQGAAIADAGDVDDRSGERKNDA